MIIIDVREKEEFEAEHIPDSISCPLSQLDTLAPGLLKNIKDGEIVLMCRSGKRAKLALKEFEQMDKDHRHFSCYEGGILKWKKEGKAINGEGSRLPLIRQVHMIVSVLLLISFLGMYFGFPYFIYISLFVGLGLGLSGFTGFCAMMEILQRLPWNKNKKEDGPNSSCCN